jgi:hypothetical protein
MVMSTGEHGITVDSLNSSDTISVPNWYKKDTILFARSVKVFLRVGYMYFRCKYFVL